MTGSELVNKYCMGCKMGLYNCAIIVTQCPYIKAQENLSQRIKELEYSYEKTLQEGDENEVAYREGEIAGVREALELISN